MKGYPVWPKGELLPDRHCEACGISFNRAVYASGKIEATVTFLKRRACSKACSTQVDKRWPFDGWYVVDLQSGCWNWIGGINNKGYAVYRRDGDSHNYGHRMSYERAKGPIPDGLVLDHLCRNTRCVNPDHLEPVTFVENLRRGAGTKLRAADAEDIRRRRQEGETVASLAREYGMSESHISRVSRGLKWAA